MSRSDRGVRFEDDVGFRDKVCSPSVQKEERGGDHLRKDYVSIAALLGVNGTCLNQRIQAGAVVHDAATIHGVLNANTRIEHSSVGDPNSNHKTYKMTPLYRPTR